AAADVLGELSKETSEELLDEMPGQEANEVRELLEFDPATAGGMMNTDFVFVGDKSTRDEVLEWMKEQDLNLDQLDTIVLLDGGTLVGTRPERAGHHSSVPAQDCDVFGGGGTRTDRFERGQRRGWNLYLRAIGRQVRKCCPVVADSDDDCAVCFAGNVFANGRV